jgi:hypothetical protein
LRFRAVDVFPVGGITEYIVGGAAVDAGRLDEHDPDPQGASSWRSVSPSAASAASDDSMAWVTAS